MIDEEPWQIKKPGEPGHHEDDMKRFYPEHMLFERKQHMCSVAVD